MALSGLEMMGLPLLAGDQNNVFLKLISAITHVMQNVMLARPGTQVEAPVQVHSLSAFQLAAQACTGLSGGSQVLLLSPACFSHNPRDVGAALLPGAAELSFLC